jgi:hypothetical protein
MKSCMRGCIILIRSLPHARYTLLRTTGIAVLLSPMQLVAVFLGAANSRGPNL